MNKLILAVVISFACNPLYVFAQEAFDIKAEFSSYCADAENKLPNTVYLDKNVRSEASKVRQQLCRVGVTEKEVSDAFLNFLRETNNWEKPYKGINISEEIELINPTTGENISVVKKLVNTSFNDFLLQVINLETLDLPNLSDPRVDDTWLVGGSNRQGIVKVNNEAECTTQAAVKNAATFCEDVLAEFYEFYNYAQKSIAVFSERKARQKLSDLSLEWGNYLDQTRSQTPLELLINRKLYKGKDKNYFSSPPTSQVIFLHPLLVVENIDSAPDGEQLKESLALELIGVNFWRKPKWYRPSGISLVASYSDRPDVEDLGLGVAVHFNNQYSIGFTSRDEGSGVFITLDFLKLLSNKKAVLDGFSN